MRCFQGQEPLYVLSLALQAPDTPRELLNIAFDDLHSHVLHCSQTFSIHGLTARLCWGGKCQAASSALCEPAGMNDRHIELHALVVQQDCKVVPAWQSSMCQLKARAYVHARLFGHLHSVHCRLSRCIGSVAVYTEHTGIPRALQNRAVAESQQVTVRPLRIWCFGYCTVALCQTLALLCLLVNHVLHSSCRFCRHMLMQKVRATVLDVVQDCAPGLEKSNPVWISQSR
jgi:hypothetical protein